MSRQRMGKWGMTVFFISLYMKFLEICFFEDRDLEDTYLANGSKTFF